MPREEYQIPTSSAVGVSASTTARGATHDAAGASSSTARHDQRAVITYICGDCGGSVSLSKDVIVACPHCAGRVLYKERTKR